MKVEKVADKNLGAERVQALAREALFVNDRPHLTPVIAQNLRLSCARLFRWRR